MSRYEKEITQNGFVKITSDYEYVLGELEGNLLRFQLDFSQGGWAKEEVKVIAHELENTAKYFAEEQGLNSTIGDVSINGTHVDISTGNTGQLYNSIKARVDGFDAKLSADAQNSRGQYYAGFIEYGFHDRGDNFVPARPFMRPALYAVSEASKGHIQSVMKNLIESMWQPGGYQGYHSLQFGRLISDKGRYSSMMKQPVFGRKSGLYTRNSLEKLSLNTKRPNYRQRFRNGEVNRKFSWDRYVVGHHEATFLRQHPFWYGTFREKPHHYERRFTAMKRDIGNQIFKETERQYVLKYYKTGRRLSQQQIKTLTFQERGEYYEARRAYKKTSSVKPKQGKRPKPKSKPKPKIKPKSKSKSKKQEQNSNTSLLGKLRAAFKK